MPKRSKSPRAATRLKTSQYFGVGVNMARDGSISSWRAIISELQTQPGVRAAVHSSPSYATEHHAALASNYLMDCYRPDLQHNDVPEDPSWDFISSAIAGYGTRHLNGIPVQRRGAIWYLYWSGAFSVAEICDCFGVTQGYVSKVVNGKVLHTIKAVLKPKIAA